MPYLYIRRVILTHIREASSCSRQELAETLDNAQGVGDFRALGPLKK